MRAAGKRIRRQRAFEAIALTLPFFLVSAALYVAVARFTLAELPRWPLLLAFVLLLLGVAVGSARRHPASAEAARYLDRNLDLDERISTCVELINSSNLVRRRPPGPVGYALFVDAAEALDARSHLLPGSFRMRMRLPTALAIGGTLLLLTAALILPTTTDVLRVERSAFSKSVQGRLLEVSALRVEIDNNKQISDDLKQKMLGELSGLESKLKDPGLDQAGGIAALSDAEARLRSLLQTPSADFDALVAAARIVWNDVASTLNWDPAEATSPTDLGRAAVATQFLAGEVPLLTPAQERRLSSTLERSASQASARDAKLGGELGDGATAIRTRDRNKAVQALTQAAQGFASAERARENSLALETALSKLNTGREQLAQVGKPPSRKVQVGFRRRGADSGVTQQPSTADANGQDTSGAGQQAVQSARQSGMGPTIDGNVPAYGGAQSGPQTVPTQTGSPPSNGAPPGQGNSNAAAGGKAATSSKSGQIGGQNSSNQTGSSNSAGGSSGSSGQMGTLQGQVKGPVGGTSGAISQVKNPAGTSGTSGATMPQQGGQAGAGASEPVYVPGAKPLDELKSGSLAPPASPNDAQTAGQEGRANPGAQSGGQTAGGQGSGGLAEVRTPYKEVIGQYAAQATDALERAYIPADAKDYVKEYFAGLGK